MDGIEETFHAGRTVDIELSGQEVITVDLDNLDPDPKDILDLLNEGCPKIYVWTTFAAEYWRRGFLDAAEEIARAAIKSAEERQVSNGVGRVYALLANLQVSHARSAPKLFYKDANILSSRKTKDECYGEAASLINKAQKLEEMDGGGALPQMLSFLTRGIQQLSTRSMDEAMRSFDSVLGEKPTNIVALMGKARILYARRHYPQSLQILQQVLRMKPSSRPDPRIGIGLCYWALGNHSKAKAAWERSLEVNPSDWNTHLLLGLEAINASKNEHMSEQERLGSYQSGIKAVERAFKASGQSSASASNVLCELFIQKNELRRALKLAERTIQFADTLTILTDGYVRAGRIAHTQQNFSQALKHYQAAHDGQKKHILANLGLAQLQIQIGEYPGAVHTLDTLANAIKPQECPEATAILASLRTVPRPEMSAADNGQERQRARELFERVTRNLQVGDTKLNGTARAKLSRVVSEDMDMYVEIAGLWQKENLHKATEAIGEAVNICKASGSAGASIVTEVRLLNNLAVLKHLADNRNEARELYQEALHKAETAGVDLEGEQTTAMYNLARVYEDLGEDDLAREAYTKLLTRHPEYVDGKIRQAQMLTDIRRNNEAHELLKQALLSNGTDLNVRAFYTYFLIQSGLPKPAKDFVFGTLKDHDKHDVYSLCAAGWIMYQQARESRDSSPKGTEERKHTFRRSAEFYEKALLLDPMCAFAAQGLAIVTAEDALGALSGGPPEDATKRMRSAREALDVFGKVRESMNEGCVYFNMGHCYYARDEYDRAIENYETASRMYSGQNISVLLCLCRSWYAKATKDQVYAAMQTALRYAQKALHLSPSDKAIVYNIAMIQQKSAEMMFSVVPAKRKLSELQHVIDQAAHAQKLFASLASDGSTMVPYSRDIADQRRKYGDNMLRKGDEHLAKQKAYEHDTQTKLVTARQLRQADIDKKKALEAAERERRQKDAAELAEKIKLQKEENLTWLQERLGQQSDDEEEKKRTKRPRRQKEDKPVASGDEGVTDGGEPKKKRRVKLRKRDTGDGEGGREVGADESGADDEAVERPQKKRTKKRVVRDEDEDEINPKKKFKSKEFLDDTDDDEPASAPPAKEDPDVPVKNEGVKDEGVKAEDVKTEDVKTEDVKIETTPFVGLDFGSDNQMDIS